MRTPARHPPGLCCLIGRSARCSAGFGRVRLNAVLINAMSRRPAENFPRIAWRADHILRLKSPTSLARPTSLPNSFSASGRRPSGADMRRQARSCTAGTRFAPITWRACAVRRSILSPNVRAIGGTVAAIEKHLVRRCLGCDDSAARRTDCRRAKARSCRAASGLPTAYLLTGTTPRRRKAFGKLVGLANESGF